MRAKLFVALTVLALAISLIPASVVAEDPTITDVTYTPEYPQQGDTIKFKAKVTTSGEIDSVRLYPCWEKPSYTCGMPATMTDADSDGYYEGEYSHADWTTGNVIHVNITAKDKAGGSKTYTIPPFEIGKQPPNNNTGCDKAEDCKTEKDCKDAGFYWWDEACHESAKTSGNFTDQISCENAGYYWWSGKCNDNIGDPTVYTDKPSCIGVGYYWYDGKCHKDEKKEEPKGFIPGFGLMIGAAAAVVALGLSRRSRRR